MGGAALLVGAVLVEVYIAARRAASRRPLRGPSASIRLAAVALFGALAVTGGIAWGPRFYALAFALLVLTVSEAGRALLGRLRPQPNGERACGSSSTWRAVGTVVMLAGAAAPAILVGEYEPLPTTGPHAVSTSVRSYVDSERPDPYSVTGEPRRLTVQLWFPQEDELTVDGGHPWVVFSHGATGIRQSNESLMRELASHGYVAASLDHPHQSLYATGEDGRRVWADLGFLGDVGTEDPRTDPQRSFRLYREWMSVRTADISFVIHRLLAEAAGPAAAPGLRLVDAGRLAVMGHSLGGSAALALGRQRAGVGAVIAIEAPLLGDIAGVRDGEFVWLEEPYPVPVLNIYSDASWDNLNEWPQYAANHALLAGAKDDVVSYHLSGVGHFGLTDLSLSSPLLTRLIDGRPSEPGPAAALEELNRVVRAFLEEHLR